MRPTLDSARPIPVHVDVQIDRDDLTALRHVADLGADPLRALYPSDDEIRRVRRLLAQCDVAYTRAAAGLPPPSDLQCPPSAAP